MNNRARAGRAWSHVASVGLNESHPVHAGSHKQTVKNGSAVISLLGSGTGRDCGSAGSAVIIVCAYSFERVFVKLRCGLLQICVLHWVNVAEAPALFECSVCLILGLEPHTHAQLSWGSLSFCGWITPKHAQFHPKIKRKEILFCIKKNKPFLDFCIVIFFFFSPLRI